MVEEVEKIEEMYTFSFEKLKVWQQAKQFALNVYSETKDFPPEEKFGLVSQLRRAAISIASNIAEGTARQSKKDQAHYSQIAYGSLMEVVCQLDLAKNIDYLSDESFQGLRHKASDLAYMINALYKSQKSA